MRALISIAVLAAVAVPAYANGVPHIPEPETLSLLTIGAVGMMLARRRKK